MRCSRLGVSRREVNIMILCGLRLDYMRSRHNGWNTSTRSRSEFCGKAVHGESSRLVFCAAGLDMHKRSVEAHVHRIEAEELTSTEAFVARIDARIEERTRPFEGELQRMLEVPGL